MNNDFRKIMLSILAISVFATLVAVSFTAVNTVSGNPANYEIVLRGKDNSVTVNNKSPPPVIEWENNHPIMAANKADFTGAVVAAGTGKTAANSFGSQDENYAILLDETFQWMISGADNVLWYEGHGVFEDTSESSNVVDNLESMGYSVTGDDTEPITSSLLSPYDIVVLPTFQENLENIDSSEYTALVDFVSGGGGLFVSHESDFYADHYGDGTAIMNQILEELGFEWWFNDDTVEDPVNNSGESYAPIINVKTGTTIGSNYQSETGSDNLGVYSVNSLRQAAETAYGVTTDPVYKNSLPGGSVTFSLEVMNLSDFYADNLKLEVKDNLGWTDNTKFGQRTFLNLSKSGGSATTTLTVDVSSSADYRVQDNITISVYSPDSSNLKRSITVTVYTATWTKPSKGDALVQSGDNTSNYGGTYYAYVGADAGEYGDERTYIKWDLSEGVPSGTIDNAWLWMYEEYTSGAVGENIALHRVDNDSWSEGNITWNNQPGPDSLISKQSTKDGGWHGWNVSDYVSSERSGGDNIVSFCLKADDEDPASGENFSTSIVPKDDSGNVYEHPFLAFDARPVASYVTENDYGGPGDNLTVDVVINNRGAVIDNFDVIIDTENDAWKFVEGGSLVDNIETTRTGIAPGESENVSVTVNIPDGVSLGTYENLTVTATSQKLPVYSSSTTDFGVGCGREFELSLEAGWNLVGFEVTNENTTWSNVFADAPFSTLNPEFGVLSGIPPSSVNGDVTLETDRGYLISVPEDVTVETYGVPVTSKSVSLLEGWNLVSFEVTNESTTYENVFADAPFSTLNPEFGVLSGIPPSSVDGDVTWSIDKGYLISVPQGCTADVPYEGT